MASYSALTVAEIQAAFGTDLQTIPPINGCPTLVELLRVFKHLCRCARKIKSQLGPLGYLFVALNRMNYQRYTAVLLNLPGPTPDCPTFLNGMDPGQ